MGHLNHPLSDNLYQAGLMVDFPFLILDNVDTRSALDAIRELITVTNIYLRERKQPAFILLQDIAAYITRILNIFGAIEKEIEIGFPIGNKQAGQNVSIKLGSTVPVPAYRFEIMFFFYRRKPCCYHTLQYYQNLEMLFVQMLEQSKLQKS